MAGKKYIANNAGTLTEVAATQVSTGASNAGDIPALDASGRLDNSVMPTGIGADTAVVVASEALSAGNLVNIWNNAGTTNVRKADASTSGKDAHGFVLSAVSSGANATIYFEGSNTAKTGLTGGKLYLSTTAGETSSTAPSAAGNVVQIVGFAISATVMNFQSGTPVVLA